MLRQNGNAGVLIILKNPNLLPSNPVFVNGPPNFTSKIQCLITPPIGPKIYEQEMFYWAVIFCLLYSTNIKWLHKYYLYIMYCTCFNCMWSFLFCTFKVEFFSLIFSIRVSCGKCINLIFLQDLNITYVCCKWLINTMIRVTSYIHLIYIYICLLLLLTCLQSILWPSLHSLCWCAKKTQIYTTW